MNAHALKPGTAQLLALEAKNTGPHALPTLTVLVNSYDTLSDELLEEIAHLEEFGGTHEAVEQLRIVAGKLNRKFVCIMDTVRSELETK